LLHQGIEQCRFAMINVRDDGDVSNVSFFHKRLFLTPPGFLVIISKTILSWQNFVFGYGGGQIGRKENFSCRLQYG